MKAIAKDVDGKKEFSPTRSDNDSIHRVRDEPEMPIEPCPCWTTWVISCMTVSITMEDAFAASRAGSAQASRPGPQAAIASARAMITIGNLIVFMINSPFQELVLFYSHLLILLYHRQ